MEELRHELKSPIQSIMAQAELLATQTRDTQLSSEQLQQSYTTIEAEVNELESRMASMSLISVLDKLELQRAPMHLKEVVTECVARHQPVATQNSIVLTVQDLDDQSPWSLVYIDPKRFALAVDNLVSNAIKYSCPGTAARILIGETSGSVILRVTNVGARIPRKKYHLIFEKFERLTEQESEFPWRPGTGIGLAIVRRMVLLHEGRVSVESVEAEPHLWPPAHRGRTPYETTFTVELPRYTHKEG